MAILFAIVINPIADVHDPLSNRNTEEDSREGPMRMSQAIIQSKGGLRKNGHLRKRIEGLRGDLIPSNGGNASFVVNQREVDSHLEGLV